MFEKSGVEERGNGETRRILSVDYDSLDIIIIDVAPIETVKKKVDASLVDKRRARTMQ